MLDQLHDHPFVRRHGWRKTLLWGAAFVIVSLFVIDPFLVDPIVDRLPDGGDSAWWMLAPWIVIALVWWVSIRGLRKGRSAD